MENVCHQHYKLTCQPSFVFVFILCSLMKRWLILSLLNDVHQPILTNVLLFLSLSSSFFSLSWGQTCDTRSSDTRSERSVPLCHAEDWRTWGTEHSNDMDAWLVAVWWLHLQPQSHRLLYSTPMMIIAGYLWHIRTGAVYTGPRSRSHHYSESWWEGNCCAYSAFVYMFLILECWLEGC